MIKTFCKTRREANRLAQLSRKRIAEAETASVRMPQADGKPKADRKKEKKRKK